MLLIPIFIQTDDYNLYIEIAMRIWNLLLILTGLISITDIGLIKGVLLTLFMVGFEMMIQFVFGVNII